jgi:hypothetical protein
LGAGNIVIIIINDDRKSDIHHACRNLYSSVAQGATASNNYNSNTVVKEDFAVVKQVDGRAAHMTDITRHQSSGTAHPPYQIMLDPSQGSSVGLGYEYSYEIKSIVNENDAVRYIIKLKCRISKILSLVNGGAK